MTCMCEGWSVLLSQSAQMALFSEYTMMKLISLGLLVFCFDSLCYGVSNAFVKKYSFRNNVTMGGLEEDLVMEEGMAMG